MRFKTIATAIVLLVLCSTVLADTLSVPVGATAYISEEVRGQTRGRLLVSLPIPDAIQRERIDFALLVIPGFRHNDSSADLTVRAHAVTAAWEPGLVTWSQPWTLPGGDFDTTDFASYTVTDASPGGLAFDVTPQVKRWRTGAANCGIILTRPNYEGGGFGLEGGSIRQAGATARLKFWFSRITR